MTRIQEDEEGREVMAQKGNRRMQSTLEFVW